LYSNTLRPYKYLALHQTAPPIYHPNPSLHDSLWLSPYFGIEDPADLVLAVYLLGKYNAMSSWE
jgi:hypothetical protein